MKSFSVLICLLLMGCNGFKASDFSGVDIFSENDFEGEVADFSGDWSGTCGYESKILSKKADTLASLEISQSKVEIANLKLSLIFTDRPVLDEEKLMELKSLSITNNSLLINKNLVGEIGTEGFQFNNDQLGQKDFFKFLLTGKNQAKLLFLNQFGDVKDVSAVCDLKK